MTGPEQPNDNRHYRHLSDTTVTYSFNKQWALMGNYDYGIDTLTAGGKAHWQGVAGYLRYSPTERLAFTPRYEWFDDHDGFSTGTPQRIKEFTMTGEYKLRPSLITRLEFRRDWSNQPFFPKSDPTVLARSQSTVLAGLIWTLGLFSNSMAGCGAGFSAATQGCCRCGTPTLSVQTRSLSTE